MAIFIAAVSGYLLGSIPVGLIVGRLSGGRDVRDYGSGKTGFTNSLRVLGLRRSLPVLIGDLSKGIAATLLPLAYTDDPWARAAGGIGVIVGHVWPVFAGFRGGRGVLAGAGALLGLNPIAALLVVPFAVVTLVATRYMSLTSIAGCATASGIFIGFAAAGRHDWAYAVAATVGAALIVAVHRDNIRRLLAGTEPKIGRGGERRAEGQGAQP